MAVNILRNLLAPSCRNSQQISSTLIKVPVCSFHPSVRLLRQPDPNSILEDNVKKEELDKLYRMVEVEVRGHDPAVLKSYSWFATSAAKEIGVTVGECWTPKKPRHERLTLLKSVHIYKKHRVQYEFRTYFRFMQFLRLTGSTADTFLEYIQRNLPEGCAMKVTRVEMTPIPPHLAAPPKHDQIQPKI